jgi:hypothetical protein
VRLLSLLSVLLVVVLAGCSSRRNDAPISAPLFSVTATPLGGSPGVPTKVVHYAPFIADGGISPDVMITKTEHGTCVHRQDDQRADMFDCTVAVANGSNEDGPCFYGGQAPGLICPGGPQLATALEVVPSAEFVPPSGSLPATSSSPFALTMSNGKLCIPFSLGPADTGKASGLSLTYVCAKGQTSPSSRVSALYGAVDRSSSTWTAHYRANLRGAATLRSLNVATAWY